MSDKQINLQLVFIHEMGHFVAAELNNKLFNYDRRIEKLKLYPRKNSKFYNGEVYSSKSTVGNYLEETCSYEYAQVFYGCLFEALFRNIDIKKCLLINVTKEEHLVYNFGNGKVDSLQLYHIGLRKEIKEFSNLWYEYISKTYFEKMESLTNHFEEAFDVNVNDHILERYDSNSFKIDINKLLKSLTPFIKIHEVYFDSLIKELQLIQNLKN